MGNNTLFRALKSSTRIAILQKLCQKEMHVSGLSRELGISVPVTARHIKILEEAELINKRIVGNIHLLTAKTHKLEKTLEPFVTISSIELTKKKSIFDALKQVPGIEIKKVRNNYYIQSIDGDKGYYIYEVDGKLPKKPVDEYIINKDVTLDIKKLISVKKKKIKITIREDE